MSKKEIAILVCKIISLYSVIAILNGLPFYLNIIFLPGKITNSFNSSNEVIIYLMIVYLPILIFTILLWLFSDKIADKMINKSVESSDKENKITVAEIYGLCFSILGLYIIVGEIKPLVNSIAWFITQKDIVHYNILNKSILDIAVMLIKIFFCLWLLLTPQGLLNIIIRFRKKNQPQNPAIDEK